jgi:hypothetical protein
MVAASSSAIRTPFMVTQPIDRREVDLGDPSPADDDRAVGVL